MEVGDDYRNGFLLPVGDTASMARAGLSLLKDSGRLQEFKNNAASLVQQKFRSDIVVSQYEQYYQEVLDG